MTVTGTTAPGNTVYVAATNTDHNSATTTASTTAPARRHVQRRRPGHRRHDACSTSSPSSPTARPRTRSAPSCSTSCRARSLLDVDRPERRRQRPGQLRLPDVGQLPRRRLRHPALPGLRRRHERHLPGADARPDADVRQPARRAARRRVRPRPGARRSTSTAASFPQRNYQIAPAFGLEPADRGAGLRPALHRRGRQRRSGTVTDHARTQISRFITFSVPKATLGHARRRAGGSPSCSPARTASAPTRRAASPPTPQDFQFGVCAAASADPHCTVDPGTVPKAMDVLTPAGVAQSDELDYTLGPVVIQGVTIP